MEQGCARTEMRVLSSTCFKKEILTKKNVEIIVQGVQKACKSRKKGSSD